MVRRRYLKMGGATACVIPIAFAVGTQAQTLQITGRVLERAALQPVPGAAVKWNGSSPATVTDSLGRFTLTGSATAIRAALQLASPYFHAGVLRLVTAQPNLVVTVTAYTAQGESVSFRRFTFRNPGAQEIAVLPQLRGSFFGFVVIRCRQETYRFKVLHTGDPVAHTEVELAAPALSKAAPALGTVNVTMAGLVSKGVSVSRPDTDVGDIILDYPPRAKIGVGAATPYGAIVLFDGSQGSAAGQAQMLANWKPWWRFTTVPGRPPVTQLTFKIAKDPQYESDTNRVTMRMCCTTDDYWGYNDAQAKIVHGDAQLHVEWISMGRYTANDTENPDTNSNCSQDTSQACYFNSGVYVQSRHEIQIEANPNMPGAFTDVTPSHGLASIVGEEAAASNQFQGNGKWNAYDITFRTTRYKPGDHTGSGDTLALMTVWWNGVRIHLNHPTSGAATGVANHSGEEMNDTLYGLKLQDEKGDVRYRNIWIKNLKIDSLGTNFGY